jgi:2,3-bisphosphoglycerate-independent phosphoglycerate mutase
MKILLLFLDGVGLGADDPEFNVFAVAELPTLHSLLGGQRLLAATPAGDYGRARFVPTDACLGVDGLPQSATGQATILTGQNVPRLVGGHWGPKPNAAIAGMIRAGTLFSRAAGAGLRAGLLNAYPQRYFAAIASGRRNYSAVPLAVTAAGLPLLTAADLAGGQALSADFTAEGWPEASAPRLSAPAAGHRLAGLAAGYDFAFFEYWISDYIGHRGDLAGARAAMESLDAVLGGLLEAWDDRAGLIVITSDHGNLEDLRHRHHTANAVPTIIVGEARHDYAGGLRNLTGIADGVRRVLASW